MKARWLAAAAMLLLSIPALARELRVCADPNNLPFSNRDGQGLENRLVQLLAKDLGATVEYTWWAQRRGALRNTLNAGRCDVVPGIASSIEGLATTRPYYRASYVFLARAGTPWAQVHSFDDPALRQARIGVQLVGDDGANTPPAHALSRRGIVGNVRGYMIYGNYAQQAPQASIAEAVAKDEIDIAVVWGPTAAFFAKQQPVPLALAAVTPWLDGPQWPMAFDISLGVRRDDVELRQALDAALLRNQVAVAALLREFGVAPAIGTAASAAGD
ncbi:MAG TPA: quinoprotein dehydrogenase-associated putative ABC transporter substrate-binding protein [Stenotrophomonas sp.]|nr:quinoprotein dehydrogenase-associated putative ABC transporter substrate-binding protein [Stenotrophomonas sp.]